MEKKGTVASRTEKSIRNLVFALVGQIVSVLISMLTRYFFIKFLSVEYVGLSGLFSNLLTMLSLVELGIGPAMTYSLYKPIAQGDTEKIKSLMHLYKILYRIVGIAVLVLGLIMLPFYRFFIKEVPSISNLDIIFLLYVANTGVSYFYSYKRTLIEADQNRYISTLIQYIVVTIMNAVQIAELMVFHSYIVYMIIQVAATWIQNFCIAKYADKRYAYLKEKKYEKVSDEEKSGLKKNIGAMILHKVGSILVLSTDNIIISKMLGLASAGIFANYDLITRTINNLLYQVFNSIVASVGNLKAQDDKEHLYEVFNKVFFLNFWIYGFCSICLITLLNPFMKIWLGDDCVAEQAIVAVLVVKFYLYGMQKTVRTFRDAAGLYYEDRYKPVLEVLINLGASIILVKYYGMTGVFLGTILSTLTTCFWIEPWILFKNCFNEKLSAYFFRWIKYGIYTTVTAIITICICGFIGGNIYISFVIKCLICILLPNVIFLAFSFRTEEFKYYKEMLLRIVFGKFKITRKEVK